MRVLITIDCDNDAFYNSEGRPMIGHELACIFKWLASKVQDDNLMGVSDAISIIDTNGNRVGRLIVDGT